MTTHDSPLTISRRKALAGIGGIGFASFGAGLGTTAFFSDEETFSANHLVAGELDLKVDWQVTYTGADGLEYVSAFPDEFQNDPNNPDELLLQSSPFGMVPIVGSDNIQDPLLTRGEIAANLQLPVDSPQVESEYRGQFANVPDDLVRPIIDIADIKPGDRGEVTFSLHLFDNPGYIWLIGSLLENRENSVTETEQKDPDEDDLAPVPEGELDNHGELADELFVTIWYDEDGDNVLDPDEEVIVRGSLAEILELLSTGVGLPLDGDRSTSADELAIIGDGSGTLEGPTFVDGNPSCADLGLLRAIKIEDPVEGSYQTPVGTVTLSNSITKDGGTEIKTIDWAADFPVQAVIVKGGPGANVYEVLNDPSVGSTSGTADAPGELGISHLSFCYDAEPGGGNGDRECYPNSTTQYIGFEWELPVDHANEIQTDSVSFDLGFYTEQCRHNDGTGQSPDQ